MSWPLSQDYNEAIQSPQISFSDPELRAAAVALGGLAGEFGGRDGAREALRHQHQLRDATAHRHLHRGFGRSELEPRSVVAERLGESQRRLGGAVGQHHGKPVGGDPAGDGVGREWAATPIAAGADGAS